uniref:Leucine rich repeat-containing protein n=1 Tax=Macrostomum lignano TaxID=282301 RepID=A0A1I8FSA4_9PLAT
AQSLSLKPEASARSSTEASRLTFLARLDLSCNQLRDLPLVLESLELLQHLNLSANQFSDLPLVLASFSRLQYLNLFNNRLCRLEPAVLGCLTSLRTLNLNSNSLGLAARRDLSPYSGSQLLAANRNQLTSLPVELFGCLASLRVLQLQRNCLTELPESAAACNHLEYLDVACNQLQLLPASAQHQEQEALGLKELCARAVMQELRSRASPLRDQLKALPAARRAAVQCSRCAVCGGAFLNTWLEMRPLRAVQPVRSDEQKPAKMSTTRARRRRRRVSSAAPAASQFAGSHRALVCSYKCFNGSVEFYGLAFS